ncbi:MAG: T9SS type A sorting domain-containing protein, partial [Bacteroidales bacterium]|nr:T9SS type A sorting domain-containing protein [Bacteroidales bacterium]
YGSNNGIFRSEDGGQTWELHFSGLTGTPYSVFKLDTTSYIAGTSGMIMKYTESQATQVRPVKIMDSMVYPNPANKSIYIDINTFPEGKLYSITNYNGILIKSGEITGSERVSINVESWPKGLYVLSVWSANKENMVTKKFIVN